MREDNHYLAQKLRSKVLDLLNSRSYSELKKLLILELSKYKKTESKNIFVLTELAGAFISLGDDTMDSSSVKIGLDLFLKNTNKFEGEITKMSLEYCIGNGYEALYKISIKDQRRWEISPEYVKGDLFNAKHYFLRSFKLIDMNHLDELSINVLTNLANNLVNSGRIVEALQLYDLVLRNNRNFPQAMVGKADSLRIMIQTTKCAVSISLYAEIYYLFQRIIDSNQSLPAGTEKMVLLGLESCSKTLDSQGFDYSQSEREFELNQKEFEAHTPELKFYLENFLSLNEHGLFCKCNEAQTDDLAIGHPGIIIESNKIVELEHLLNRLKSEFAFARKQIFEYRASTSEDFMHYQDFGVHNLIYGIQSEKLRMSFRMCFGILDKIAQGILYLFELEKANKENTYFESFWRNKNAPKDRWERINEFKNIHLTALYSIACDLSNHNGEFSFYKEWRNHLEHDMFTLIPEGIEEQEILFADLFSENKSIEEFEEKALHLLQLVRAAIFSFTFCCREELLD